MDSLTPHSPAWYDRLSRLQRGYFYPWRSHLPPHNGEDTFLEMLGERLAPNLDVLDVGCGHGELDLELAPGCRSILAYDRVQAYIDLAQEEAARRGVSNVTFVCADSSVAANGGSARIPAPDGSFDLLISRRGPLHWIEDARRVARPGASLFMLNPMDTPRPDWYAGLPAGLDDFDAGYIDMIGAVTARLQRAGLALHAAWTFDVPETFDDAYQLYLWRTWGRDPAGMPAWETVRPTLEALLARHGGRLTIRRKRFIWEALVY